MELKGRKESKMGEKEEGRGGERREERMQVGDELLIPFKAASHRPLLSIQMKKQVHRGP